MRFFCFRRRRRRLCLRPCPRSMEALDCAIAEESEPRKGRSEKTLGSEKTLSQLTSLERRKTVARAPRNRRICAQMRRICDAQCHICAAQCHICARTMPHLRTHNATSATHNATSATHNATSATHNATSATPPCAICDASMCDLHRVDDARRALQRRAPAAALPRGCGGRPRPLAVHPRTRRANPGILNWRGRSGGWQAAVRHDTVVTRRRRSSRDGGVE